MGALNARLSELNADLNDREMRTYKASRRELFERLDRPALAPLPEQPFEAATWKKVGLTGSIMSRPPCTRSAASSSLRFAAESCNNRRR
jgi:hypothetical protein